VLVKDVTNEVLEIVRADKAIQAGDTKRVIELVDAKVLPHFDFRRMTMLAVGRDWRQASPEQQGKLTDAFRTLLVRTYSNALTSIATSASVRPSRFAPADTRVQIRTEVVQPIGIDYMPRRASRAGRCSTIVAGEPGHQLAAASARRSPRRHRRADRSLEERNRSPSSRA
jgi:phospholipid transport system substrate-binding protein